ncbi:hypothetical protein [Pseudomonas asiatica]|nr:hypothetical protein [Pseudomonas asiatica]WPX87289.1 hypothetical protein PsasTeo6_11792 [Pseudomonas asiatica]
MARPTLSDYLTYMGKAPRTKGWGALLVYDRAKTNMLLMQEHILRGQQGAWIEPVSGEKVTENGKISRLSNFSFGAPVLSFENANIGSSMAMLSMPVLGGKLTEWSRQQGASQPSLIGITNFDPLTAPRVKMNIKLNEGGGGVVGEDGRVTLDLSNSEGYYFEVSQWEELNTKLGELIEEKFKEPERGEQVWELNRLAPIEGSLNPTSFRVRTHSLAKAGNAVSSPLQEEQEEGAVIVGVAFNGDKNGDFPADDKDMPYFLPSRDGGAYTMNLCMHNEVWMGSAVNTLMSALPHVKVEGPEFIYDSLGFLRTVAVGQINVRVKAGTSEEELGDMKNVNVIADFNEPMGTFSFKLEEGSLLLTWTDAGTYENVVIAWMEWIAGSYLPFVLKKQTDVKISASCRVAVEVDGGKLILRPGETKISCDMKLIDANPTLIALFNRVASDFEAKTKAFISGIFDALDGTFELIDLLRLNGLLFRNNTRPVIDTSWTSGDLSLLGDLAPALTSFAIDPLDKVLIAGGQQKLTLVPRPEETVTWTVKAADDGSTDKTLVGEIVGDIYKAPAADKVPGTFRNIIVTATAGENSSSAQLTIVPKPVAVSPNLLSANFTKDKPERYLLEGGSIDSALTWEKSANFKGILRDPEPSDYNDLVIPRDKKCKIYVAPQKDPGTGQDRLMQLDQVRVSGGGRTETIDIITAWEMPSATMTVDAVGNALKLTLTVASWEGDDEVLPPEKTQWYKVLGTGKIDDAKGTYTPGADEGDYVIIAGVAKQSGLSWNYSVLPMPYTNVEAQVFAEVNEAFDRLQAARS